MIGMPLVLRFASQYVSLIVHPCVTGSALPVYSYCACSTAGVLDLWMLGMTHHVSMPSSNDSAQCLSLERTDLLQGQLYIHVAANTVAIALLQTYISCLTIQGIWMRPQALYLCRWL